MDPNKQGVMHPMMLHMTFLRAICNSNREAVITGWQHRQTKFEPCKEFASLRNRLRAVLINQKSVVTENHLAKAIFELETDDGAKDVFVGQASDIQDDILAADDP